MNLKQDLEQFVRKEMELSDNIKIEEDSKLTDCGLDSLDVVDMIFLIEDKYNITIPNPQKIITFADLVKVVKINTECDD